MSKIKDRTGLRYGRLTVIERVENRGKHTKWLCQCDCGTKVIVAGDDLQSGHTQSCGCLRKEYQQNILHRDLIGEVFGRLHVESYIGKQDGEICWNCKCDCGNQIIATSRALLSGHKRSCGCLKKDTLSERSVIDLTDQRFGRLLVVERAGSNKRQSALWKCACDCGNITYVPTVDLTHNKTRSCGCLKNEKSSERSCKNLVGMRFGKLQVIKAVGNRVRGRQNWECKCDCGRVHYVNTTDLMCGGVQSCGCLVSYGEYLIARYLDAHHIRYTKQKTFIRCRDVNPLPFDLYLPDYNMAIEYDGEFHYLQTEYGG